MTKEPNEELLLKGIRASGSLTEGTRGTKSPLSDGVPPKAPKVASPQAKPKKKA